MQNFFYISFCILNNLRTDTFRVSVLSISRNLKQNYLLILHFAFCILHSKKSGPPFSGQSFFHQTNKAKEL